jgi:hypothetical protein
MPLNEARRKNRNRLVRLYQKKQVRLGLCIAGDKQPVYKWQRCKKHYVEQRSRNNAWHDLNRPLSGRELSEYSISEGK